MNRGAPWVVYYCGWLFEPVASLHVRNTLGFACPLRFSIEEDGSRSTNALRRTNARAPTLGTAWVMVR